MEVIQGKARVLDGDTIEVNGSVRVRFFGVDAPEWDQTMLKDGQEVPCGQIAKQALKDLIGGQPVRCEVRRQRHARQAVDSRDAKCAPGALVGLGAAWSARSVAPLTRPQWPCRLPVFDTDHYGRKCAVVYSSAGEDLNARLVREGYVLAFTKVTRRYVGLEQEAKAARRGIWSGSLTTPADYRRKKREQEEAGAQQPQHQRPPPPQQHQRPPQQRPPQQQQQHQRPPQQRPPQQQQQHQRPPQQQHQQPYPQQHQQQQQAWAPQGPAATPPGGAPSQPAAGGEAHWLVRLLEALLGTCMSGDQGGKARKH